jgi:hypothetical protein
LTLAKPFCSVNIRYSPLNQKPGICEFGSRIRALEGLGSVTEQAALAPPAEDASGPAVPPTGAGNTTVPDAATPQATLPGCSGGRWFPALCGVVALMATVVTLAAPTLRPAISRLANAWLGTDNAVSRVVAPSPEADAGWRMAREQAMQALDGRLAGYTARLDRFAATQQVTNNDVARAVAALKADHSTSDALVRAVDDLTRQTKELHAAAVALDGRSRAVGLLTLSLRLRRDVDAGLPINHDYAALTATGPYPLAVDRALQQLRQLNDGVPTMRDLADEFDQVIARFAARSDATGSWSERGWARISRLFGGGASSGNAALVAHLRALAVDGRFSEAAEEISASSDADLGTEWAARVRARARAVVAAQVLLNYALTAYDAAYAAPVVDAAGKPTQ